MSKNQSIEDTKPTMVNEVSLFTDVAAVVSGDNEGVPMGLLLAITY